MEAPIFHRHLWYHIHVCQFKYGNLWNHILWAVFWNDLVCGFTYSYIWIHTHTHTHTPPHTHVISETSVKYGCPWLKLILNSNPIEFTHAQKRCNNTHTPPHTHTQLQNHIGISANVRSYRVMLFWKKKKAMAIIVQAWYHMENALTHQAFLSI